VKRMTPQRRAVLEVLKSTRTHPDAAWIHREVKKRLPSIGLGTVYRTLDLLVKEGLAVALNYGGATRYDANTAPHPHFVCRRCQAVYDLELAPAGLTEAAAEALPGARVESARLTFFGLCPSCAQGLAG